MTFERITVHVNDDTDRIAMLEVRTVGTDPSPASVARYTYSNHLSTATLELDGSANIISYEEYHPYGTTCFQSNDINKAVAKRYRYTNKERDDETGLYYFGARYYTPWLARWCAVDPQQNKNAPKTSYGYCSGNPVCKIDPNGKDDIRFYSFTVYTPGFSQGHPMKMIAYSVAWVTVVKNNQRNTYSKRDITYTIDEYGYVSDHTDVSRNLKSWGSYEAGEALSRNWKSLESQYGYPRYTTPGHPGRPNDDDVIATKNSYEYHEKENNERLGGIILITSLVTAGETLALLDALTARGLAALAGRKVLQNGVEETFTATTDYANLTEGVGSSPKRNLAFGLSDDLYKFAEEKNFLTYKEFTSGVGIPQEEIEAAIADPNSNIHFNLTGMRTRNALKEGILGPYGKPNNVTNWELYKVYNTEGALERTTFYRFKDGAYQVSPSPH